MLAPVPAFTAALTLLARLALATPPPHPSLRLRAAMFAPLAGLAAVALSGLLGWGAVTLRGAVTLHHLIDRLGLCPVLSRHATGGPTRTPAIRDEMGSAYYVM
jgi:hypothetical protein